MLVPWPEPGALLRAAEHVTEQVLFETFSRAGSIQSVRLCRESSSRRSLGYGYINYQTPEEGELSL
jgi:polyadenylate-binding protein